MLVIVSLDGLVFVFLLRLVNLGDWILFGYNMVCMMMMLLCMCSIVMVIWVWMEIVTMVIWLVVLFDIIG